MHRNDRVPTGRTSRRQFLSTSATLAAGALGAPLLIRARASAAPGKPGANSRITVGAIGVGGRASLLLQQLPEEAQIVALSDCNLPRAEAFKAKAGGDWPIYQDYRKLLDRKDIDAVIVATGEFQRVVPCIHACQAGKDVYAEKPLTLYVREGRALVDAVRTHDRVLQVGSQQRSMAMNRVACELVRSGGLGKVLEVRAINYTGPQASPAEPPARDAGARRAGLERVAQPGGLATVQSRLDGLDAVARFLRRRDDQLGAARRRPDSMGLGHGRHRAGRDEAACPRVPTDRSPCSMPTACRSTS